MRSLLTIIPAIMLFLTQSQAQEVTLDFDVTSAVTYPEIPVSNIKDYKLKINIKDRAAREDTIILKAECKNGEEDIIKPVDKFKKLGVSNDPPDGGIWLNKIYFNIDEEVRKNELVIKMVIEKPTRNGPKTLLVLKFKIAPPEGTMDKNFEKTLKDLLDKLVYTPIGPCLDGIKPIADCEKEEEVKCCPCFSINNSNKTITYDLKSNTYLVNGKRKPFFIGENKTLNVGDAAIFKVTNLNPFKYSVSLYARDTLFPVEVPSLFSSGFDYSKVIGELGSATKSATVASNSFNDGSSVTTPFFNAVLELVIFQEKLTLLTSDIQNLVNIYVYEPDFLDMRNVNKINAAIVGQLKSLFDIQTMPIKMNADLERSFYSKARKLRLEYMRLTPAQQKSNKDLYEGILSMDATQPLADCLYLIQILRSAKTEVILNIPQIGNVDQLELSVKLNPLVRYVTNYSNTLLSPYTRAKRNDTTKVLAPKVDLFPTLRVRDKPFYVPVYGGIKIDFSVGLFFSSLKNMTYTTKPDSTVIQTASGQDTTISKGSLVVAERSKGGDIGLAAQAHIYPRLTQFVNPAFSFGVGYNFDKQFRYLLGGSLVIGTFNKLAVGGGIIVGRVDRLSERFQQAYTDGTPVSSSVTDVDVVPVWDNAFYWSLSYAFHF